MNQPRESRSPPAWLDAKSATALLQIKRQTLYAYVSRGLVRSRAVPGGRKRVYFRDDLLRLKQRHDARAGHAAVASAALRWGEPVLDSQLTQAGPTTLRYRGHNAISLAASGVPFESVAELLWSGTPPTTPTRWPKPRVPAASRTIAAALRGSYRPLDALASALPVLAIADPDRFHTAEASNLVRSRTLITQLATVAGLGRGHQRAVDAAAHHAVAARLAVALGSSSPRAHRCLNAALILCADHELNASTFAARITASAGADVYACVTSALATLSGPGHGGMTERITAMLVETERPEHASGQIAARLRRGDAIPGFGQPLYPEGDPRAPPLLALAHELAPRNVMVRTALAVQAAMLESDGQAPALDFGLVALAAALRLDDGSAAAIFAIGRSAGWVAHILEQRASGSLLRPRARYTGPLPVDR